jgi:hypothetical protein
VPRTTGRADIDQHPHTHLADGAGYRPTGERHAPSRRMREDFHSAGSSPACKCSNPRALTRGSDHLPRTGHLNLAISNGRQTCSYCPHFVSMNAKVEISRRARVRPRNSREEQEFK